MRDLVQVIEKPTRIIRRLGSSRRSGCYYFFKPAAFGLNNSPYEPLFSVETEKAVSVLVDHSLMGELTIYDTGSGLKFPLPRGRSDELKEYIFSFKKPAILGIGWCAVDDVDLWKNLHRYKEFIIFDLKKTRDLYRERSESFLEIKNCVNWDENKKESQGSLSLTFGELKDVSLNADEFLIEERSVVLFNHKLVVRRGNFLRIKKDNEVIIINNNEAGEFFIVSYDHSTYHGWLDKGQALLLSHPFPTDGNVD